MINHTPAKVDSYYIINSIQFNRFQWECSCGNQDNGFDSFVEAYDDLKQHCESANDQLIVDLAMKFYDIATHKKISGNYDFAALAKHVLENGYKG